MALAARPNLGHRRQPSRLASKTEKTSQDSLGQVATHDDTTVRYIKRVLCTKPAGPGEDQATDKDVDGNLEDLLPPLTTRKDIDVQLYAIIAIILSQFVQSWYNRITLDADFVSETLRIIARCTRDIEERLKLVGLESLLLDELPDLLDAHLDAVQTATDSSRSRAGSNVAVVYQVLRPHNALSPIPLDEKSSLAQQTSEADWSQMLVASIVQLVLPPEDLANPCLEVLVNEIFSEMIVHKAILGKACEPWMLWEGVMKAIHSLRPSPPSTKTADSSPLTRLEQFGLLSGAEAVRGPDSAAKLPLPRRLAPTFWTMLQYLFMAWLLLRAFVTALMQAPTVSDRQGKRSSGEDRSAKPKRINGARLPRPMLDMRIWSCLARVTSLHKRMPWLAGSLSMMRFYSISIGVCSTNSAIDRLLSAQLHERLLNAALLPPILQAIRSAVFPDNMLGPVRQPPTSEEVLEIRRACARAVVDLLPEVVRTHYFATKDRELMHSDVEQVLDLFADPYVNKHLVVAALELIVVRLFPELAKTDGDG